MARNTGVDACVVGAGVVGLAIGRELALHGLLVSVFEKNPRPGLETSSRNSGVVHAGIYYPSGSLKARACVEGRRLLLDFCAAHNVPHALCGKVIVALLGQEGSLEALRRQALDNGVSAIDFMRPRDLSEREPMLKATAALWSPTTAILSADDLLAALERSLLAHGGILLTNQEVVGLEPEGGAWRVHVRTAGGESYDFKSHAIVNAAGLHAHKLAAMAGAPSFQQYFCKGDYFWTPRPLLRGLVYPLPPPGSQGLGIHSTVDLGGRLRFGPDTRYVTRLDYRVDESMRGAFHAAISQYLEGIQEHDLFPDISGIRPRLRPQRGGFADFYVRLDAPGLLNMAGIESPGLTSCLALAREAARLLGLG